MGISGIGMWQLLILLLIVVLVFGTKRLKNMGGDLGSAVGGFRKGLKETEDFLDEPLEPKSDAGKARAGEELPTGKQSAAWADWYKRSLASLLPPSAEGGCARRHNIGARPLWYRSLRSTYPTGVGGSPAAPRSRASLDSPNRGRRVACGSPVFLTPILRMKSTGY